MSGKNKLTGTLAADMATGLIAGLWTVSQVMAMRWFGNYDCGIFDIVLLFMVNVAVIYARRSTLWLTEG